MPHPTTGETPEHDIITEQTVAIGHEESGRHLENTCDADTNRLELLAAMVARGPAVFILFGPHEPWPLLYASDNVRQYGIDPADLCSGKASLCERILPEDVRRLLAEFADYARRGVKEFTQEYRIYAASGEVRWVESHVMALIGPQGEIASYQSTVLDITDRKQAEDLLRAREEKFRAVFQFANDAMFLHELAEGDRLTHFEDVNEVACRRLGYTREELLRLTPPDISAEDSLVNVPALLAEMRAHGHATFESVHVAKDGTHIPVEIGAHLFTLRGRTMILAIARDISERKHAEQELREANESLEARVRERTTALQKANQELQAEIRERTRAEESLRRSEARFRILSNFAPIGIFLMDPQGHCTYVNPRWEEITGRPAAEGLGLGWLDTAHPEDREHIRNMWLRKDVQLRGGGGEARVITTQGELRWIDVRVKPILGENNVLLGYVGAIEDIAERKQAQEQLQERESILSQIFDAIPVGLWQLDREGKILRGNPAGRRIWGGARYVGPEEFGVYKAWHADTGEPVTPEEWSAARALREGEPILNEELNILTFENECKTILSSAVPLRDAHGQIQGLIVLNQDITARKRAEDERARLLEAEKEARDEAQRANAAKDQFLAVLSHELRNPLSPVLAGVELLRRTTPPDQNTARILEIIERNTKLQARLIDDLLDLSRLARGKMELRHEPVALDVAVQSAVETMDAEADRAGLTVHLEMVPDLWVNGDFDRLQQIVVNLLSNAIKFTPTGGEVWVRLSRTDGCARIIVEDTGIGIDKPLMERLFEMFQQGEAAGQRRQGLGIGLALVRSLAEMQGGRVWAESEGTGKGARFTVELPLAAPAQAEGHTPGEGHEGQASILLVEDNDDARELLAASLDLAGYQVRAAAGADEALELLRQARPDIILADIGLEGKSGYEFLRLARQIPGMQDVPAIAVTGYGQDTDIEKAREAGFAVHLTKPVDLAALDRRIRECLSDRPAGAQRP